MNFKKELIKLDACEPAVDWVGDRTKEQAWKECHRGDWMLWLLKENNLVDLKTLTKCKVECAKLVIHLMKDERSLKALKVAENFANGDATRVELNASAAYAYAAYSAASDSAASAAYAAAYTAYADAAAADDAAAYAYAAYSAASDSAASAAYAAASAASAAASAAAYTAYADAAAADDAAAAARKDTFLKCADIIRSIVKSI